MRSSRLCPASYSMVMAMERSSATSTAVTSRTSKSSATALTGRLPLSSISNRTLSRCGDQNTIADQFGNAGLAVHHDTDLGGLAGLAQQRDFVEGACLGHALGI